MFLEVRLRVIEALEVRRLRGPTIQEVEADETEKVLTWKMASNTLIGVREKF